MTLEEIEEQINTKSIELDNLLALKEQIKEHNNEWINKYNNTFYIDDIFDSVYKIDNAIGFNRENNGLIFAGSKIMFINMIGPQRRCEFMTGILTMNIDGPVKTQEEVYYKKLSEVKEYIEGYQHEK